MLKLEKNNLCSFNFCEWLWFTGFALAYQPRQNYAAIEADAVNDGTVTDKCMHVLRCLVDGAMTFVLLLLSSSSTQPKDIPISWPSNFPAFSDLS